MLAASKYIFTINNIVSLIYKIHQFPRRLGEGVICTEEHMKRCASKNMFTAFDQVVDGTRKVIRHLCQPEPIRNG